MKIKSVRESQGERGPKILVYGESGSGKTRLIETLPGRVLILSAERGLMSLSAGCDADVVDIEGLDDMRDVVREARKTEFPYAWLALDSLSEIAEVLLSSEKKRVPDPRQAYGELQDAIGGVMRVLRDLSCGVYAIAKEQRIVDEDIKRTLYRPSMPGSKLGDAIPYVFDEVFRLVVERDGSRVLRTRANGAASAKDRSGKLDEIEPADMAALVAKMVG